ncbi:MAG: thiamine-phosphate kinase [Pseudomonadales bacterium]|nr:thiamine-phosphate kinase [Pseudomonadales bacterium]
MPISEFELIKQYFDDSTAQKQCADLVLGIGDDGAIISPRPDHDLIVAVDTLVAGVHFLSEANPYDIGFRSLAVNLSDLAAMGAEPAWFTLALTLPGADEEWLKEFSRGLFELARSYQLPLIGGDTTRGPLTISIQVLGYVPSAQALCRDGAKVGDLIYVTGSLGDAAGGLRLLQNKESSLQDDYLQTRFLRPQARLKFGQCLRGLAHAAIDISDGLLADIGHITKRSGVGARVELARLPLSVQLKAVFGSERAIEMALSGGDDYELCFCVAPTQADKVAELAKQLGLAITCIGCVEAEPGIRLYNAQGEPVDSALAAGYQHF